MANCRLLNRELVDTVRIGTHEIRASATIVDRLSIVHSDCSLESPSCYMYLGIQAGSILDGSSSIDPRVASRMIRNTRVMKH